MKKIAFLFPGQGAQYPGMAKDFCEAFACSRAIFEEADDLLHRSFSELIFFGNQDELVKTKNAQLAIYIASMAILEGVREMFPSIRPVMCAGLSLGEYSALTAGGKLSFSDCLPLVALRGEVMDEACTKHPGTMRVVLGLDEENVRAVLPEGVWIANLNCPGQIVISGENEVMSLAEAALKERGARRVLPLDVSGAFHSGLMRQAQNQLERKLVHVFLRESDIDLVMNAKGEVVQKCEEMREMLIRQVTSPVYWEKGIRTMMARGMEGFLEVGPGKTLAGMNQRIGVNAPTFSIEKVEDLEKIAIWEEDNAAVASR